MILHDSCTRSKIVLNFLFISRKQLSESVMPRVCSFYNPSFIFGRRISFLVLYLFIICPLFLLYGIWGTYPRLIISCSIGLDWYALSRHRVMILPSLFNSFFWLADTKVRLITELSITSVTSFYIMSACR